MDTDENLDPNVEGESKPVEAVSHKDTLSLEILQVVKDAQSQHGLKHSDYHRYRAYCARRVKRIRKSLNFIQATGSKARTTFAKKTVTNQMVVDAVKAKKDPLRYLYIPLICAERCWAHAMALKQDANTEHRKKFHLIRKLKKSVQYAHELLILCNREPTKCDARTKLESQAYYSYLSGIFYFETEKWRKASNLLQKAQAIYTKLCEAIGDEDTAVLYKQRIDELKPTLRFCSFNLGDKDSKNFLDNLKGEKRSDDDYLAAKLDQLILQTREKQADTLSEVNWLGKVIAVKHEKVRAFLMALQENQSTKSSNTVEQWEKLLFECRDSLQLIRESNQEKTPLYCYLLFLRHDLTIQRNLGLIAAVENKSELIRLYEVIISSLTEISSLPLNQQFSNEEEIEVFLKKIDAQTLAYKAFRCYYIGKVGKLNMKQSVALLHRASQYCAASAKNDFMDEKLRTQLQQLGAKADGEKFVLYANSLMEEDEPRTTDRDKNKPLIEKLDVYNEDPAIASGSVKLAHFPPDFKPIPCKPLFFDLALNHIDMPSLESEMTAATGGGLTGFVKGLWGWKK